MGVALDLSMSAFVLSSFSAIIIAFELEMVRDIGALDVELLQPHLQKSIYFPHHFE
jgi:hypothetical protein